MNPFGLIDNAFCVRAAETLVHFLWQGLMAVGLVGPGLRRGSANLRYSVYLSAVLLMAGCVPVTFILLPVRHSDSAPERTSVNHVDTPAGLSVNSTAMIPHETQPAEDVPVADTVHPLTDFEAKSGAPTVQSAADPLVSADPEHRSENPKSKTHAEASPNPQPCDNGSEAVTVAGTVVLEDGTPASTRGLLSYDVELENGNRASGNAAQPSSEFSVKLPAGEILLKYYLDGFAPSWTEPFQLKPGESRDAIRFVLTRGRAAKVTVVDETGSGVAGAKLVAHPEIHGQTSGPIDVKTTEENGEYTLQHLADTRYAFRVTAPGFQPLRTDAREIDVDEGVRLTLIRSRVTTGRVTRADGTPAVGAKLRAIYAKREEGPNIGFRNEGDGFWGEVFVTTGADGRFELDQLAADADYLFLVEAADGARCIQHLQDGVEVNIAMPPRRDLRIEIVGDIDELPKPRGKPSASIRQRINFEPKPGRRYGALVGQNVPIEVTPEGGTAVLRGVVSDSNPRAAKQEVEIRVGNLHKVVPLNRDGDTDVTVNINSGDQANEAK